MAYGFKSGGRAKGTKNKPNPLKDSLRTHSMAYFEPKPQLNPDGLPRTIEFRDKEGVVYNTVVLADADGNPLVISDFDIDMMMMEPKDRATIHEKILRYHTPQMQSVSAEVSMEAEINTTFEEQLKNLAKQNDG